MRFWWRDDDAIEPTSALDRLLDLSERLQTPVHLAVIPQRAKDTLAYTVAQHQSVVVFVHGWSHSNRSLSGEKKSEFGGLRPDTLTLLKKSLYTMSQHFGGCLANVFVPPWNRISPDILPLLVKVGYTGLSTYGPRSTHMPSSGLVQVNTHVDPINWRKGGGLINPEELVARLTDQLTGRRLGQLDNEEPLGLLTHHLVHTPALWHFVEELLQTLLECDAEPIRLCNPEAWSYRRRQ
ncbi:MAG: polysaccharide deacetylase family protein [Pseudomonadota bacterium]